MRNLMNIRGIFLLGALVLSTGCNYIPYRIDIDQGNIINPSDLSRIRIGMSKAQVKQALGTPLLTDIFHNNRWDYVQYYKNGRTQDVQEGKVSLFFTNDVLSKVDAEQIIELKTQPVPYRHVKYRPDGEVDKEAVIEIYNKNKPQAQ